MPQSLRADLFDVRAFGAVGDGKVLDTDAINRAIAAAGAAGGGVVFFPAGEYLSYSIRLQSNITLQLVSGATIIAADPPLEGQSGGYDAPESSGSIHYQDFGHSHFHNSLIWGEHLENVAITGSGRIYGRGLSRGNGRVGLPVGVTAPHDPDRLPDVLEADGPINVTWTNENKPGPFGYPSTRDALPAGIGNKAIALNGCRNITFRDFSILHGGHFGVLLSGCDNVTLDNLFIDTNRDGIDVDACANVRISNCSVNSPWDDGICLKASFGSGELRPVENVTISNCYVSGFVEGTLLDGSRKRLLNQRGGPIGRIKLGTEGGGGFRNIAITNCVFEFCRGLALEQVDGGVLEDIVVSNLTMRDVVNAPLFIRLGARLVTPAVTKPSSVRRILIRNVIAYNVAPEHGVFIAGLPGNPIQEIQIDGLQLHSRGGGTAAQAGRTVPELPNGYPEPLLFGTLPSWGIYARHAEDLQIRNATLRLEAGDDRPAIVVDDVHSADFGSIGLPEIMAGPSWSLHNVSKLRFRDCDGQPDTGLG